MDGQVRDLGRGRRPRDPRRQSWRLGSAEDVVPDSPENPDENTPRDE